MRRSMPYAFGTHTKKSVCILEQYWIMPYAFGVSKSGWPDTEGQARIDKAMEVLGQQNPLHAPCIFLGADMEDKTQPYAESLAGASASYLKAKYNVSQQLITIYAKGRNTVSETQALYDYFSRVPESIKIETVTSWWHTPRVWIICWILFGKPLKVHAAKTTHQGRRLAKDIIREIAAFPLSIYYALYIRISYMRSYKKSLL